MNMRVLAPSRKKQRPGNIFVFQMPDDLFRYGRVIHVDVNLVAATGARGNLNAILAYIYRVSSPIRLPVPTLRKEELLLPPLFINDTGWHDGYFETVDHRPLQSADVLPVHCFYDATHKCYVGQDRKPISAAYEPCGLYAVGGYGAVDWDVSKALRFPPPAEDHPTSLATAHDRPHSKKPLTQRSVDRTVIVHIEPGGELDLCELEDRLAEAISANDVGELEGHEIAVDGSGQATIYLFGKDLDRLADVVLSVAREAGIPKGSFVLKRHGSDTEEHIQL